MAEEVKTGKSVDAGEAVATAATVPSQTQDKADASLGSVTKTNGEAEATADATATSADVDETPEEPEESLIEENVDEANKEDTEHAESLRRKRDREGSLEPSLTPSQKEIPTKKNRLQDEHVREVVGASSSSPPLPSTTIEGEKVGQIRKRVEDLSWKQRKEGHRDGDDDEEKKTDGKPSAEGADVKVDQVTANEKPKAAAKSSQPTFASFAGSSGFGSASAKKAGEASFLDQAATSVDSDSADGKSPPALPARTQPTFSSFSKSSSPFNAATASIAGPSWLAGKSSTSGGLKPSSLGSVAGSSHATDREASSSAASPASPPPSTTIASGKGLGFGAFAATNPFSAKSASRTASPVPASKDGATAVKAAGDSGVADDEDKASVATSAEEQNGTSFDEALRKGEVGEAEAKQKVETQLDKGQVDLRTGEEDEVAVASARAKLFTMAEDQSWKERGTGTVRCNVPKNGDGRGRARLVMRSEGVLRLILNITLFKGMKVNLEQDKFLRIVAFEEGKPVHFALRIGNAATASQFYYSIQDHIPTVADTKGTEEVA